MKAIFILGTLLFISSCSNNPAGTQAIISSESSSVTNISSGITSDTGVITHSIKPSENTQEKILEFGASYQILQTIYKDKFGVEQDKVELFYIDGNKKKTLLATTGGGQMFKDVRIDGDYLYFTYLGTGGEVMNIVSLGNMKIVSRIRGGTYTDDKKYLYSCSEGGYGPGEASMVDLREMKSYNAFGFLYSNYKGNREELNSLKCELKQSNGTYNMEFSTRNGYDTNGKVTQYNFNFATKKLTNLNTKEIMTIPVELIPENLYAK